MSHERIMNSTHSTFAALVLLASSVASQNLVTNGDFSNGTNGWTMSGYALDPKVVAFDTNGVGSNNAFSMLPGQQTFRVPVTYNLEQKVISVPTVYEFSADVAALQTWTSTNADGGKVEVFLGTQLVTTHSFGRIAGNSSDLKRERICVRFTPKAVGSTTLSIRFSRAYLCAIGRTPRNYIDNIQLRRTAGPSVCMRGERKVNSAKKFEISGTAGHSFALFAAPKLFPTAINIPGIGGALELDLLTLALVSAGSIGASGTATVDITVPSVFAGVPIYWQALGIAAAGNNFGPNALIGFYK